MLAFWPCWIRKLNWKWREWRKKIETERMWTHRRRNEKEITEWKGTEQNRTVGVWARGWVCMWMEGAVNKCELKTQIARKGDEMKEIVWGFVFCAVLYLYYFLFNSETDAHLYTIQKHPYHNHSQKYHIQLNEIMWQKAHATNPCNNNIEYAHLARVGRCLMRKVKLKLKEVIRNIFGAIDTHTHTSICLVRHIRSIFQWIWMVLRVSDKCKKPLTVLEMAIKRLRSNDSTMCNNTEKRFIWHCVHVCIWALYQ